MNEMKPAYSHFIDFLLTRWVVKERKNIFK